MTKLTWDQTSSPDPYVYFQSFQIISNHSQIFLLVYLYKTELAFQYTTRDSRVYPLTETISRNIALLYSASLSDIVLPLEIGFHRHVEV